jgi:predicted amidohydrolase YtcJ
VLHATGPEYPLNFGAVVAGAVLACLVGGAAAGAAPVAGRPAAELIIRNARIWTVNSAHAEASAVAVLHGRIVAVGTDASVDAWRGPTTRMVDAGGRLLLPGFNDAHVHFEQGGRSLAQVQLNDATSAAEFARRIGEHARQVPRGEWVVGGGWDDTKWNPARLPTRQLIDAVVPDRPVAIDRYDGHMVVVNSLALKLAGITAATPDPVGGVIVRDESGEPTGALKDAAAGLVVGAIPPPSRAQRRSSIERALRHAASVGVTSVQTMNVDYEDIAVYSELTAEGRLTVRLYAATAIANVEDQARLGIRHAFGSPTLRIGAVKAFADGSVGSRTAYFLEPYTDDAANRGLLRVDMQPLSLIAGRMRRADDAGLQLCTHAIGDAAVATVLDLYGQIAARTGPRDRRWRIEHAQHIAAWDFRRFAELGVVASMQPYHAIDDGRWIEARIGQDRGSRSYALRTLREHGVHLAFGTDWPVAPLDPMQTLYAATTRATLDGRNPDGWFGDQKLSIRESIEAYTLGSAYAEFQDQLKGSIQTGKLADFVLLSEDVLAIAPEAIRGVKVLKTWVGGTLVYDAGAAR